MADDTKAFNDRPAGEIESLRGRLEIARILNDQSAFNAQILKVLVPTSLDSPESSEAYETAKSILDEQIRRTGELIAQIRSEISGR